MKLRLILNVSVSGCDVQHRLEFRDTILCHRARHLIVIGLVHSLCVCVREGRHLESSKNSTIYFNGDTCHPVFLFFFHHP